MNRRVIGLIIALVLAAIATIAVIIWLNRVDERAQADVELTEVFVATADIPAGTAADQAISQGLIVSDEVPARNVAPGAIGSLEAIQGTVATTTIFQGEQIVTGRFGSAVETPSQGGLLEIPDGTQAVSVQASVVPGVAGFVRPGDTVSVVAQLQIPEEPSPRVQYAVQNALVLAVGQRVFAVNEQGEKSYSIQESNANYIFTVALPPVDIERLLFAAQQGSSIWFTIQPETQEGPVNTPGRTIENALS